MYCQASLLTGMVFDETGERLTPTYAVKKGTRYRYYVSTSASPLREGPVHAAINRLPAPERFSMPSTMIRTAVQGEPEGVKQGPLAPEPDAVAVAPMTMRAAFPRNCGFLCVTFTAEHQPDNALSTLGERETGTERLKEAISAYREALRNTRASASRLSGRRRRTNLERAHSCMARLNLPQRVA